MTFWKNLLYQKAHFLQILLSAIIIIAAIEVLQLIFIKETISTQSTDGQKNTFLQNDHQDKWLSGERESKKKMILMVVDSLGFYLAEPNLKSLSKISREQPDKAILLRSVTDSFTVTGPRLLSMMTGTNPSVVDLIQNVEHSNQVNIDNILEKLLKKNKHIYLTGDDTWLKMFPGVFESSNGKASYNIFGKNDQDYSNMNYVFSTLRDKFKSSDADLIISHFLGIDHAFHSHGVQAVEVSQLYSEYDKFINGVISAMSENHVLIVCSDHGALPSGNHGGDSQDERETFFFMYSKTGIANNQTLVKELLKDIPDFAVASQYSFSDDPNRNSQYVPFKNFNQQRGNNNNNRFIKEEQKYKSIMQLDTAVNLSNILGLTLPYSSLGMVWPFLYEKYVEGDEKSEQKFKDDIANDCFTTVMQQFKLMKENKVFSNLIGDELINQFEQSSHNLQGLYNNYKESKGDMSKLRELFNASYQLNIDIKNSLWERSLSLDTRKRITTISYFVVSIIALACLLASRKIAFEEEDRIKAEVERSSTCNQIQMASYKQEEEAEDHHHHHSKNLKNEEIISIIPKEKGGQNTTQNKSGNKEASNQFSTTQKTGILIFTILCFILCLFSQYAICTVIITITSLFVLGSYYPTRFETLSRAFLSFELVIIGEFIVNNYIITIYPEYFKQQDADFFKMLVIGIILLFIFKGFIALLYFIPLFFLVFVAQYFSSNPSPYPTPVLSDFIDIYEFKQVTTILLHPIVRIYFPAIVLFYLIQSKIPTQQLQQYKKLLLSQLALSVFFISFNDTFPEESSNDLIMIYLPRFQILLFGYQTYYLFKLNSNQNKEQPLKLTALMLLFTFNLASFLMIFLEQKSILATLVFFSIMASFRLFLNNTDSPPSSISYVLITFAISFVFFFSTEHRYGFGNLQIKAGYIGMGTYYELYAIPLIMLNTFAWHLYSLLLYPVFISAHECKSMHDLFYEEDYGTNKIKKYHYLKSEIQTAFFQFFIAFAFKYSFTLMTVSVYLGTVFTYQLIPYLIGDTMISGMAFLTILILQVWSNKLCQFKTKKEIL